MSMADDDLIHSALLSNYSHIASQQQNMRIISISSVTSVPEDPDFRLQQMQKPNFVIER
jgi:hypothetical protein